ncbi:MAG TPA: hypothetical protein VNC82_15600 [Candidatus Limnocylindria bacterium]|nr:hypothetical protein [Candidatus Limnocylindria bacterium]
MIAIYVGFDLVNPLMPGAFIFDPGPSVEGVPGERGRQQPLGPATPAAPRVQTDGTPAPLPRLATTTRKWLGEPRPAHVPASDPPPLSEDH